MKKLFLVLAGMMAGVALAGPRTISINFGAGYGSGSTVTGVYGIEPSEHWQNLSGQSGERHDVEASDGSKCSVSWSCRNLHCDYRRAKDAALKAYLDDSSIEVSISNIPFPAYTVIVYQSTDCDYPFAPPSINGVYYSGNGNQSWQRDYDLLAYGDPRVLTAEVGVNTIPVPNVFSGDLSIEGSRWSGSPDARGCIAAIQIVEVVGPSKCKEEVVEGVTWCYSSTNGVSTVEGYGSTGKRHEYTGDLIVPNTLGGLPVTGIGNTAFWNCSNLHSVVVAENVTNVSRQAFSSCANLRSVKLPSGVEYIGPSVFWNSGNVVVSLAQPNKRYASTADGIIDRLTGKAVFTKAASVEVLSTTVRKNDPTIIDVEYKVTGNFDTVDVRALAFLDGTISWSNVVRPETFVADTNGCASVIGDGVTCGEVHHFSWKVSADYTDILAKFKLQLYVRPCELLHLDLMRIPAREGYQACEFSINELKHEDVMNALYWLYAVKSEGFTLSNGELRYNNIVVARKASLYNSSSLAVYDKMGYSDLKGDTLSYVNDVSRLKLTPSGFRQYAFKWLVK